MTRAEFLEWLETSRVEIYVRPYDVVPCACRDRNCKGWRLVPAAPPSVAAAYREPAAAFDRALRGA